MSETFTGTIDIRNQNEASAIRLNANITTLAMGGEGAAGIISLQIITGKRPCAWPPCPTIPS